jgi:hypothetical protein
VEHISAADIAEVLKGAKFPARKNDLVAVAIRNNPVILEQLPGREFNSVTEVEEAFPARNEGQGPIKLQRLERYGGRSKSLPFPPTAVRRWSAPCGTRVRATLREVERYTKAANRARLADSAMATLRTACQSAPNR